MKTGIIFYVKTKSQEFDLDELKKKLKHTFPDVDEVEITASPSAEDDILHAWWKLTVRGIKRILLRFVEVENKKDLKHGMEIKLAG